MKKVLLVVLALLISVAFVTTVFAQGSKRVGTEIKTGQRPRDQALRTLALRQR